MPGAKCSGFCRGNYIFDSLRKSFLWGRWLCGESAAQGSGPWYIEAAWWGFGPISIVMVLLFSAVGPAAANIPFPSSLSALANATAFGRISLQPLAGNQTIIPGIAADVTVADGPYGGCPIGGIGGTLFQPDNSNARLISRHKSQASSEPAETRPVYSCGANCFICSTIRFRSSTLIDRGALNFSSASAASSARAFASAAALFAIAASKPASVPRSVAMRICHCWLALTASSNANKLIVNTAPRETPPEHKYHPDNFA